MASLWPAKNVAIAQITAFRAWEQHRGERFARLGKITQPCLVVDGVFDNMIPVRNSYMLSEHLPNAMLLTYPTLGMDRCSSFTSHSFGKLRCFSIQKASAEGFGSIRNPKLHPLRDLEVAQFVASGRVRLGIRSP